ncbi:hypothetical protein K1719_009926 [Acacia pycnantha]|nr:hypothetical protein K1719_009926 [Acacia pycnantha]
MNAKRDTLAHKQRMKDKPIKKSVKIWTARLEYFVSSSKSIPHKNHAILDEDAYVAAIEKIIERDFFPDISKLRDRLDWLEAIKTGDPVQIRDAVNS